MVGSPKYQIILLPAENYWEWVQAVRDYALHFRVSVTPHPENAANFHHPDQAVTVVDLPGAYPDCAPLEEWFAENAPQVPLDIVEVTNPLQLRTILAARIADDRRYGDEDPVPVSGAAAGFALVWPTDYQWVTQPFAANPDLYSRWGLPGHEGLDIRAPLNSNVYACADGEVYRVSNGTGGDPYGIHVRIRHRDGYKTVYAHLNQALVHTGQLVKAGDRIGLADSTGNSSGSHLHLTLKKEGATASGETTFPHDIIDPTPYMVKSGPGRSARFEPGDAWPYDQALVGVVARQGGPMEDADWEVIRAARVGALKMTTGHPSEDITRVRQIKRDILIVVQLSADLSGAPVSAARFADIVDNHIWRFYSQGVRYFEVHDSPNLTAQGFGTSWQNGREFGQWFLEVIGLLRPQFPEGRFGWPALYPGPSISGIRFDDEAFLQGAEGSIRHADWIGCRCYWRSEADLFSVDGGLSYRRYLDEWADKLLLISGFSNPSPDVGLHQKGSQYLQYYRHLQSEPGVGAAFAESISSAAGTVNHVWRTEDGRPTPIVTAVASRLS
jgi:hypothetical protein